MPSTITQPKTMYRQGGRGTLLPASRARVRPRSLVGPRLWLVPPVGLEPTTFGLKVRSSVIVWLEYADVLARSWLARYATIASNSAIAGNTGNSGSRGVLR